MQESAGFLPDQAGFLHDFACFHRNTRALSGVSLLCRRLILDAPLPASRLAGATLLDDRTEAKHVGSDPQSR
jgi:hypothetical protein